MDAKTTAPRSRITLRGKPDLTYNNPYNWSLLACASRTQVKWYINSRSCASVATLVVSREVIVHSTPHLVDHAYPKDLDGSRSIVNRPSSLGFV